MKNILICNLKFLILLLLAAGFSSDAAAQAYYPSGNRADRVETISTNHVGTEMRVSALESELRNMNGRLEHMEFAIRSLEQILQRMQNDYESRLAILENAGSASAAAIHALQMQAQSYQENPAETEHQQEVIPLSPPVAEPSKPLTAQQQYDQAMALLKEGRYSEAEKTFKTFINKNPKSNLVSNARYWYAEAIYAQNRYDEAAVAFRDSFQQNPKGGKAPDSLLKLGLSLSALKEVSDACITLKAVKQKFPDASKTVRDRADKEIIRLKCPK
ncbi:MAG: tol-pal system protein YbgF [Alphaproteobacteria bacterium]|nr:tol-pal system protein YbgF [Alphaproteobacteria bacterium]